MPSSSSIFQSRLTILPNTKCTIENCPKAYKMLSQRGENSSNLVTLVVMQFTFTLERSDVQDLLKFCLKNTKFRIRRNFVEMKFLSKLIRPLWSNPQDWKSPWNVTKLAPNFWPIEQNLFCGNDWTWIFSKLISSFRALCS